MLLVTTFKGEVVVEVDIIVVFIRRGKRLRSLCLLQQQGHYYLIEVIAEFDGLGVWAVIAFIE